MTVTLAPNTPVRYTISGTVVDADYNSWQEGRNGSAGVVTYAAITSRSHHSGTVNSLLADGSTRSISDTIDIVIWRALGTRSGQEIMSGF